MHISRVPWLKQILFNCTLQARIIQKWLECEHLSERDGVVQMSMQLKNVFWCDIAFDLWYTGQKNEVLLRHFTREGLRKMVVRRKRSGNTQAQFKSQLLYLLALWLWTSSLTSLCLHWLTSENDPKRGMHTPASAHTMFTPSHSLSSPYIQTHVIIIATSKATWWAGYNLIMVAWRAPLWAPAHSVLGRSTNSGTQRHSWETKPNQAVTATVRYTWFKLLTEEREVRGDEVICPQPQS